MRSNLSPSKPTFNQSLVRASLCENHLSPSRKCATPSYSNNVCIVPWKGIYTSSPLVVSPIGPIRRPVAQFFLGSVNYLERPPRWGTGSTKTTKKCFLKKDHHLSNSTAQVWGEISAQLEGRWFGPITFLKTNVLKEIQFSVHTRLVLLPKVDCIHLWESIKRPHQGLRTLGV